MDNNLLQSAVLFASMAHMGQMRKHTSIPYIVHPIEVMKIVAALSEDAQVRAAAVLHDTVEDAGISVKKLRELFGDRVADMVAAESENKREGEPEKKTWLIRKQETLRHLSTVEDVNVKIICLGDKLANMRDIARDYLVRTDRVKNAETEEEKAKALAEAEDFWQRFNAPDDGLGIPGKMAYIGGYYRGVADRLKSALGDTDAWQELDWLITKVYGDQVKDLMEET